MTRKLKRTLAAWLFLSPLVVLILFPFAVTVITALKPAQEVLRPTWWPSRLVLLDNVNSVVFVYGAFAATFTVLMLQSYFAIVFAWLQRCLVRGLAIGAVK